ncbi:hypothetical protein LLE49_07130 [Alicyclobacillus tolerans]|uniref:hypothetical protein n=1 Tax=Alicyclobacillus tolerans TaxID=90970 RepID=UPI001F34FB93|nr:hypothetical protein [Alicyclobacillus tolerans]MCF8564516.1 hypothetical protein [Alicyclobacillus tolerans]
MIISESNRKVIKERFEKLAQPVVIQFFETSLNCASCPEIKQLLEELVSLSDLLTLETLNLYTDEEKAKSLGIDKAPVIVLTDDNHFDYGIRFFGPPSGYEFATLLEDVIMVSQRDSGLSPETRKQLASLPSAVDLSVFVTPT